MIYDYYIDKRKYNKLDEYVDIHLLYPIETTDYEYLKVKLCDFKFLNNIFNISSTLMNNQFNIRRYSKTYTYTWTGTALYIDDTGFFNDKNALLVNEVVDGNTATITNGELSLVYVSDNITTNSQTYWVNILSDTTNASARKLEMEENFKWFEIISADNNRITSLNCIFYKDTDVSGTTTNVTIKFQKYDPDAITWVDIVSNILTFQNAGAQEISQTFTYANAEPNNKYRLICVTPSLPFPLYIIKLQADKQIPVFDAGIVNTPVEHTITIPDGFYKASNFRTILNELLTSYKLTASIDQYNNKLKISNDNPTFVPAIDNLIDNNYQLELVIPNIQNMLENWGITDSYQTYIPVPFNSYYEGDTHINLINLSKIIITTDLNFQNKTHNDIIKGNEIHRGFGNILAWIDTDEAPYTCIKYRNYEDLKYKIENRHISTIRLRFYNEKSQPIILDNSLIHLQIIKYQKKSF